MRDPCSWPRICWCPLMLLCWIVVITITLVMIQLSCDDTSMSLRPSIGCYALPSDVISHPQKCTVPFHSIRRSHVTALPKSTKCHTCHTSHRVADENSWGNMSQCEKTDFLAQIQQSSSEFSVYKCLKVLGKRTTEISHSEIYKKNNEFPNVTWERGKHSHIDHPPNVGNFWTGI
jgi:hypothetical protein